MGKHKTMQGASACFGNTDKGPMVSWGTWDSSTQTEYFSTVELAEEFFNEKVKELESYPPRPMNQTFLKQHIEYVEGQVKLLQGLADRKTYGEKDFYLKAVAEEEAHLKYLKGLVK